MIHLELLRFGEDRRPYISTPKPPVHEELSLSRVIGIVNLLGATLCGKFAAWLPRLPRRSIRSIGFP